MDIEEVREFGLALPQVTERSPFGPDTLALEIGGRMFCLMDLSSNCDFYILKADPEYSIELRERYESIRPGYHMNKRHWISVDFNGDVPESLQRELIRHSYMQTIAKLPKKLQKSLGLL
ncbi:MAG: MmcQ/YjbR family DNA-binding protein [Muribaculaceae bacterium]|nr:MmcQ/YjbR family DNA-binding protein [Muribaculaceae bacterium]